MHCTDCDCDAAICPNWKVSDFEEALNAGFSLEDFDVLCVPHSIGRMEISNDVAKNVSRHVGLSCLSSLYCSLYLIQPYFIENSNADSSPIYKVDKVYISSSAVTLPTEAEKRFPFQVLFKKGVDLTDLN